MRFVSEKIPAASPPLFLSNMCRRTIGAARASVEDATRAFEQRRRPRVALVQRESLERIQANQPMDDRRLTLRNQVMRKVGLEKLTSTWRQLVTTRP